MRIVGFDKLDELWREAEVAFQAEADFDAFFASWKVDLDELNLTVNLPDFGNIDFHDVVK